MQYCLDCVIKHLADAKILQEESLRGYPEHILDVIGNLSQAEREIVVASSEIAEEIRQYRLLIIENMDNPTIDIPYYELFYKVKQLIKDKGCGNCKKASDKFKQLLKEKKNE